MGDMPAPRRRIVNAALAIPSVLAAALFTACGPVHPAGPQLAPTVAPSTLRIRVGQRIVSVPLEDYVMGSALSEISPTTESPTTTARLFDVQTILARTYAVAHIGRHHGEGFDLCDGTHCQLYQPARIGSSRFTAEARAAVDRTRGELLWYGDHPIDALFHADCGGYTDAPENIWGGAPLAYLQARKDQVASLIHCTWRASISRDALRGALNADAKTSVGARLDSLAVRTRDVSGRAAEIVARGEYTPIIHGEDLRAAVNRVLGPKGVQSTRFSISVHGGTYYFDGEGFGHGVGLCQVGATARLRLGASVAQVLGFYFPGASLSR
jgi:stage II sporulation protein D